jgi:hypothetical protein
LDSIEKYNEDGIKVYMSIPQTDTKLFQNVLGTANYTLIEDESISKMYIGWIGQQIVKAQFWKLGLCENYLVLDSDSQFIRKFYKSDFIYSDDIPYTVCHECKHFFEFCYKFPLHFDPYESYKKERLTIMEVLDRRGIIYDFGNSPVIWSKKVWSSLEENYFKPNNMTFEDVFQSIPSELTWYGEWLLTSKAIPIFPREPLFRSFSYQHMYEREKKEGLTLEILSKFYLGYVMPSSWNAPLYF